MNFRNENGLHIQECTENFKFQVNLSCLKQLTDGTGRDKRSVLGVGMREAFQAMIAAC